MHVASSSLQGFLLPTVHLAEVHNPTYVLVRGKKYPENIYEPASPWVKGNKISFQQFAAFANASRALERPNQLNTTWDFHAPPHIDIKSMARSIASSCAKAIKYDVFNYISTLQCVYVSGSQSATSILIPSRRLSM